MVSETESPNQNSPAHSGAGGSGAANLEPLGNSGDDQHPDPPPITEQEFMEDAQRYMALVPDDRPPVLKGSDDWKASLIMVTMVNKKTKEEFQKPERKSQNNVYLMTRYSEELRGLFIMNEFSCRKMMVRCPPWERPNKFKPRDVRDDDYGRLAMELERMGMLPTKEKVVGAVESICFDRSFHPVQRYFRSLTWDKTKRLQTMLRDLLGAESEPADYLAAVGMKTLVAAVARVMNPGCKFDHMIVLEGPTDIGKSAFLRKLATFHGEEYFYDGMTFGKISDKDTMQNIQGNVIIEFPELSQLGGREVEEVKQWITMQEDRGRKPYGREPVIFMRQFILAGTTNNDEYLKDATGNKRFWPVRCGDRRIDLKAVEAIAPQLWAEAYHLFNAGYPWWIPDNDPMIEMSKLVQLKRMVKHPWTEAVLEYVQSRDFVTCVEVLIKGLSVELNKVKRAEEMIVADVLKQNGWESSRSGQRGWKKKKRQEVMDV